ncbi:MAG: DNA primase [Endozoicomonadaceae bacterium]|nr:DNA primase [Endozoicomonadaceae bacterium]
MSKFIPTEFIDDLLTRINIVDVIKEEISLKKTGRNYTACCPFHQEKTPSFTVSPEKQFYYCFGCGAAGNVIGFIAQYHQLSFPDTIKKLADKLNLTVPDSQSEEQRARQKKLKPLYDLLQTASTFYQQQLMQSEQSNIVRDYLVKRGLTESTIKTFSLGFAPPGWTNLLDHAKKFSWKEVQLQESGLVLQHERRKTFYDRFRQRIIFPIKDLKGHVVGFGGRTLSDEKPKYLNSPETPVFHKGHILYGLYEAKKSKQTSRQLIVVEGYMDVIALAQHGFNNVVATLGTATTSPHISRLFYHTEEIIFCFDGDTAGRNAARKALEVTLPLLKNDRKAKFLFLPAGEDPDSVVAGKGTKAFRELLQQAITFDEYLFNILESSHDTRTLDGKAAFARQAKYYAEQVPDPLLRELLIAGITRRTELSNDIIRDLITPTPAKENSSTEQPASVRSDAQTTDNHPDFPPYLKTKIPGHLRVRVNAAKLAMRILLKYPALAMEVSSDELSKDNSYDTQMLLSLIKFLQKTPVKSLSAIRGSWHNTVLGEKMTEIMLLDLPECNPEKTFMHAINKILINIQEQKRTSLKGRSRLEAATKAKIALKQNFKAEKDAL